jgi:hypothetical protein
MTPAERGRRFRQRHGKRVNRTRRIRRLAAAPVVSVAHGTNADLIRQVCKLHLGPTDTIADLTYGRGVFWKGVATTIHARLTASDLVITASAVASHDFRATPYADKSFDVAVLDPPYVHTTNSHATAAQYQHGTIDGMNQADILALYIAGMTEARRIARNQVWVKCKDAVERGKQVWQHDNVLREAEALGMSGRDLFILLPTGGLFMGRWDSQHHARKVHSYLWVFDVP